MVLVIMVLVVMVLVIMVLVIMVLVVMVLIVMVFPLYLKVHGAMQEGPQSSASVDTKGKPAAKISEAAVEDKLLHWAQTAVEG